jgi:hypothetical protein
MTPLKEQTIVQYILNNSIYRIPPLKDLVQDIANKLLEEWG